MRLRFDMTVIPVGAEAKFETAQAHHNEIMEKPDKAGASARGR
jgi:hypothetical protein